MNGSEKRPLNKTYIQFNFLKQWWLLALLSIIVERTQFMFHNICIPEEIILHYYTYTAVITSYFSHVCKSFIEVLYGNMFTVISNVIANLTAATVAICKYVATECRDITRKFTIAITHLLNNFISAVILFLIVRLSQFPFARV